ncbi:MAG: sugar phosphate isomerase/epimerase family protein [Candidatus Hodarchaeota archaeon]
MIGSFLFRSAHLFLQPFVETIDKFCSAAIENHYNLEIATFADPRILDNKHEINRFIKTYQENLDSFEGICSLHGPFLDLKVISPDSKIQKVSRQRVDSALQIATELDCKYAVFHTGFNPLIRNPSYMSTWAQSNGEFWQKTAEEVPHLIILLENLWEQTPQPFIDFFSSVTRKNLGFCFDIGHWNVFGKDIPLRTWISELKDRMHYCHLNDNQSQRDDELTLGKTV